MQVLGSQLKSKYVYFDFENKNIRRKFICFAWIFCKYQWCSLTVVLVNYKINETRL